VPRNANRYQKTSNQVNWVLDNNAVASGVALRLGAREIAPNTINGSSGVEYSIPQDLRKFGFRGEIDRKSPRTCNGFALLQTK
jgi:hypothetical protein